MLTLTSDATDRDIERAIEHGVFRYVPTDDERAALDWIGGRYAVSDVLNGATDDNGITIDVYDIANALAADGVDRVPCLSDETTLQRIVWYIGPSDRE